MKTSKLGLDLIKHFEGCLLFGYRDVVGVPTIGYGHTGGVVVGQRITQAEADTLLQHDLDRFEDGVDRLVTVGINQHQFDALVAFSFNVGLGALKNSTLLKKLNARDFAGAAKEFARWNKAGGEVYSGLVRRRAAEADLFLKPMPKKRFPYPGILLKKGSKNSHVGLVQSKLGIASDNIFGPKTEASLKKWQTKHKLKADGVVGPKTWGVMFNE